jgi:hypothetical protein
MLNLSFNIGLVMNFFDTNSFLEFEELNLYRLFMINPSSIEFLSKINFNKLKN